MIPFHVIVVCYCMYVIPFVNLFYIYLVLLIRVKKYSHKELPSARKVTKKELERTLCNFSYFTDIKKNCDKKNSQN